MPSKTLEEPLRSVAYCRVSTREQAENGRGLDAQEDAIRQEAARRGWELVEPTYVDRGVSGKSTKKRTALADAVAALDAGKADVLIVTKLDRLARSVVDFASLVAHASSKRRGKHAWSLVVMAQGIDLTTATGRLTANVLASVAQWEAEMISERTKDGLRAAKAKGVALGHRSTVPAEVVSLIAKRQDEGESLSAIARQLNERGIETGRGGSQWRHTSVAPVLRSERLHVAC